MDLTLFSVVFDLGKLLEQAKNLSKIQLKEKMENLILIQLKAV